MPPITPEDLYPGVVGAESSGDPGAVGPAIPGRSERAIGLTQILPSTAAKYGYQASDLTRPEVQRDIYQREMGRLLKKYNYDPGRALAAWNDGERNVDNDSIAPSTRDYVQNALRKAPAALAKLRAERAGGGMPASTAPTDTGDVLTRIMRNPHWNDYSDEQKSQIINHVLESKGAPRPSVAPTAAPTIAPAARPTVALRAPAAPPTPTIAPRGTPGAAPSPPNLGLPGGPGVAFGSTEPVVPTLPPEPSARFPGRTFGASGPDIPTPLQALQNRATQADINYPIYQYLRRPATAVTRAAVGAIPGTTPEEAEETAQDIVPQDPTTAALLAVPTAAGLVNPAAEMEIPYLSSALRAARLPEAATALGYGTDLGLDPTAAYSRAARRLAGQIGVGGGMGAVTAKPGARLRGAEEGAVQGGVMGLGNEALGFGIGQVGRRSYAPRYIRGTVSDTGEVIGNALRGSGDPLTTIDIGPLNTARDFQNEFVGDRPDALRAADEAKDRIRDYVHQKIGGTPFYMKQGGVPSFLVDPQLPPRKYLKAIAPQTYLRKLATGKPVWMSYDALDELIEDVNGKAYAYSGDPKTSYEAKMARQLSYNLREGRRQQLNYYERFLGDKVSEVNRRYGMIKDFNRFFNKKGADFWAKAPDELPEKLQRAFSGGKLMESVDSMLGPDVRENIVRATRHGIEEPAYPALGTEMMPHVSETGRVRFRIPHTYKPVGTNLPWYVYPSRGGPLGLIGTQLGRYPATWVSRSVPGFQPQLPVLPPDTEEPPR